MSSERECACNPFIPRWIWSFHNEDCPTHGEDTKPPLNPDKGAQNVQVTSQHGETELEGKEGCKACYYEEDDPTRIPHTCGKARCHAQQDGDCDWEYCPQTRDGEPEKTGRHCPLDVSPNAQCEGEDRPGTEVTSGHEDTVPESGNGVSEVVERLEPCVCELGVTPAGDGYRVPDPSCHMHSTATPGGRISDILLRALQGDEEYRAGDGFVRWGRVERDILSVIHDLQVQGERLINENIEQSTCLAELGFENARLREALEWCAQQIWDGGLHIDGGDFEAMMLKAGLFVEVPATPEVAGEWGVDVMYTLVWSEHARQALTGEQKGIKSTMLKGSRRDRDR